MNTTAISVDTVLLHVGAHTDEHEAFRRIRAYGERLFPGVSKAKVKFTRGVEEYEDSFFDAAKVLPIGCAKTRFDEHRKGKERLPGECATTLVSQYLGIESDKPLKRIAKETLRCDTESGVQLTELPELVKMLNRRLKNGDGVVLKWAVDILNAIHRHLVFNTGKAAMERTLIELFGELEKLDDGKRMPDGRARESTRRFLQQSTARRKILDEDGKVKFIFELAHVAEALYRTDAVQPEEMAEWLWFALEHLYYDQVAFWEAVDECKKNTAWWYTIYKAEHGEKKRRLTLCAAKTENPMVSRASRHSKAGGADITIVRRETGHFGIFLSDKKLPGLNLDEAVAMLRWYLLPQTGKEPIKPCGWEGLKQEGEHPSVPGLYYFRKANQLLNGSESHPDVKPCRRLDLQTIIDVLQRAFSSNGVEGWKEHHLLVKKPAEARQSAPEAKPAADAKAPAFAPEPQEAEKTEAGTNNIGEALKKAAPRKRSKSSPEACAEGEKAQATA
ncbi:MAG: hypothetical protein A2W52_00020 [Candidatus Taylorbacteria bacterium RIFCSPHIGHO2_02_49_25]|uniref:Uncharacterized protein n=1 Tax=Candidatus Taylorbacteria bacterium RIFCSPHIGHO2_02_49_25 TaxID=1802305 RepID=A0A1G2MBN3_9BACT|nr:MAG: hypothetical protein A2W52_00020 [Candidatus Taylorbacteria bacterium RIFCSPHIGHO2_02_49_25]OHA35409.1 MAG: hypothetical protein A2W65_04845 [Candidatus Taylorbacteria bacterium RIFCSPLOWO2_02_50_13]OHA36944.1 MAG: hypothetical protein A3B27_00015 [Candidatus Taylorbacteria bacterium RIFCSPLOWO2_01_FULL_50_130]OHA43051.1 MAG: hypothetical protein A3H73_03075 [Candidatus Taylorbacteria bacterium RIFCSPLOWO2_02_FULL_50_120]HCB35669.1 hypothetical protein [Candidatus Taylorbacteria bacteri